MCSANSLLQASSAQAQLLNAWVLCADSLQGSAINDPSSAASPAITLCETCSWLLCLFVIGANLMDSAVSVAMQVDVSCAPHLAMRWLPSTFQRDVVVRQAEANRNHKRKPRKAHTKKCLPTNTCQQNCISHQAQPGPCLLLRDAMPLQGGGTNSPT